MPLWTLAIETVATAGSVALLRDDELVRETVLPAESRSARTLAAAVQNLWQTAGKPAISLVAVAQGPGSFTGLRVGITTAKALAYSWQAKLLGINSLDAIAAQCAVVNATSRGHLEVILDAQRQELFVARFRPLPIAIENCGSPWPWERLANDSIISSQDWIASLTPASQVAGPALTKLRGRLPETIPVSPETAWHPRAETIGRLALIAHQSGAPDELWTLVPHYGRPSYAEEAKVPRKPA